jgi:exodeoxyribonuclease VII large subunit
VSRDRVSPEHVIGVGRLTLRIAERLQSTDEFKDLWVEGEVSEATVSTAGHVYFTLRDQAGQLRCVLLATRAASVPLTPRVGARLLAHGYVEVYPQGGRYQLRCDDLLPAGAGEAHLRREALKRRLEAEGIFKAERKRALPPHPRRVGVVTSPSGAAWRDIQTIVARRDPGVELVLAPALVQGGEAVASMIGALDGLAQLRGLDVVIVARGGGASEDLWPFDDEALVRAVARSPWPVCTGVGHETDVTLVDLVADMRAPTPSGAAELVVPDASATRRAVAALKRRLDQRMREALERRRARMVTARRLLDRRAPAARVALLRQRLDEGRRALDRAVGRAVPERRRRAAAAKRRLDALSPLAVLGRGYAVVEGADGKIRTSASSLSRGDTVRLRLRDGRAGANITSVETT